jgi:two-component sensor histidine kinase
MKKEQKDTSIQKEIDHRIKNNLNIVSSILGLQISSLNNGSVYKTTDILKESKLRIDALAMVHDASHKSEDLKNVDFKKYVQQLCNMINNTYNSDMAIEVKSDKIDLELDTMLRIGVIITELLTNSLKYAFAKHNKDKKILITLKKEENNCLLTYFEKGDKLVDIAKIKQSKALGIRLIMLTVKQMNAHMNITHNGGLLFTIDFCCEKETNLNFDEVVK